MLFPFFFGEVCVISADGRDEYIEIGPVGEERGVIMDQGVSRREGRLAGVEMEKGERRGEEKKGRRGDGEKGKKRRNLAGQTEEGQRGRSNGDHTVRYGDIQKYKTACVEDSEGML